MKKTGLEQVEKIIETMRKSGSGTCCVKCKEPVDIDINGMQKVSNGFMCDDCYFEELGDEVEKHPICSPRRIGR